MRNLIIKRIDNQILCVMNIATIGFNFTTLTMSAERGPRRMLFGLRYRKKSFFAFVILALVFGQTGVVSAQAPNVVPPTSTDAGQIEQQLGAEQPVQPVDSTPEVFDEDRAVPPPISEEFNLTLNDVVIEGSTVYAKDDFAYLYEHRIGQEIALSEVFKIADKITAKYRNDGYILSRAIVPPQTIADGTVRINIVEGYINEVRIEGELSEQRTLLDAYAEKIIDSRPLSTKDLERYLLFFRDLPGVNAKATIRPAKDTPGASDLVILVDFKETDGFARVDNRGSKFNGPGRFWFGAGLNSLTDTHQRMALTSAGAGAGMNELTYLDLALERHIDAEGKKLYVHLTNTLSQPGHKVRELDIASRAQSSKIGISSPLIRSRSRNLSLYSDFVVRNSKTTVGTDRLSKDRIRFISLGALYDSTDRFGGVNQLGIRLDKGLDVLDASEEDTKDLSRAKGQVDFTKLWLNASRLQLLSDRWSFLASLTSQIASSKLLASEEFGVGGENCVRAYDPAEITGDSGACLLLELRFGQNFGANPPIGNQLYGDSPLVGYQVYGYYDVGEVRRKDPGALGKRANLASVGLGVRLNYKEWLSGSFEITWPRKKTVDSRAIDIGSRRFFMNLTARF